MARPKLPKDKSKHEMMTLRSRPDILDRYWAATFMRGIGMSTDLHQHMVKVIREEEERNAEELNRLAQYRREQKNEKRKRNTAGPDSGEKSGRKKTASKSKG